MTVVSDVPLFQTKVLTEEPKVSSSASSTTSELSMMSKPPERSLFLTRRRQASRKCLPTTIKSRLQSTTSSIAPA